MALAIGANTAIFSMVNGVLLKALPYERPDRLYVIGSSRESGPGLGVTSAGIYHGWKQGAPAFASMAALGYQARVLTWNGEVDRVLGVRTLGSPFEVVGRGAAEGRVYTAADDGPEAERVIVLSARLARRMFGGGGAVGRAIGVNGEPHTVIGVMPADFALPDHDVQFWLPARLDAAAAANRDQYYLQAVARLADGATVAQAEAQLAAVMDGMRARYAHFMGSERAALLPMKELVAGGARPRLLVLMGAVALILLVACANLGNLLLARASARRREMALRQALGARPLRLVRQMLTESVLLAGLGGLAGVGAGLVLLRLLVRWMGEDLPRAHEIGLDGHVLAFTAAVSVL
jgi:predicted permease